MATGRDVTPPTAGPDVTPLAAALALLARHDLSGAERALLAVLDSETGGRTDGRTAVTCLHGLAELYLSRGRAVRRTPGRQPQHTRWQWRCLQVGHNPFYFVTVSIVVYYRPVHPTKMDSVL